MKNDLINLFDPFFEVLYPKENKDFNFNRIMRTDIEETDKDYIFTIDIPGAKKEQIKINVKNGYLNINYEEVKKEEEENKEHNYIRKERYYGCSKRSFYVGDIDKNLVKAKLNDGILKIEVPKANKVEQENNIFIE